MPPRIGQVHHCRRASAPTQPVHLECVLLREFSYGSRARNQAHTAAENAAESRIVAMAAPTKNTGIEWALLTLLLLIIGLIVYSMR